ncbi:MAG: ABC transporter permease [Actinobacteria bacterium]|nr:ABC transporter permease [Actinomycetota bacterium]MBU1942812.1 ABC transporter permease [Actinomycetota bacterium]MBU2686134.1 ABC transporter permease [Actinomycetota bacterium]
MKLITLAWKNLQRHRIRSILTVLGIAVSAMTLFLILSFNSGYDRALKEEIKSSGVHLYLSMEGCPMQAASLILHGGEIPTYLEQQLLEDAQGLSDVENAGGMLISTVITDGRADLFYGITDEVEQLKSAWELDGSWFEGPDSVILGYDVARDLRARPGDKVFIKSLDREFKVSGILHKSSNEDDGFYFMPLETAQEIFKHPRQLTAIGVQLKDPASLQKVKEELEKRGAYVVPAAEITDLITDLVGSTKAIMIAIVAIVLLVTGLGVFNTILMATFERNEEFGYLRCVGAQKNHIFELISMETMLLCLGGVVFGVALGFGLSYVIDSWIKPILPYAPAGKILRPDIWGVLLTVAVVFVMGAVAGIYPGFRAAMVAPMEAVRND